MFIVKWAHVSSSCLHSFELCKNLLALLVQVLVRLAVWIQDMLSVLWSSSRCFGAASGEPSTKVGQIEIHTEICLGEEIWSLGKMGIQSKF